MSTTVDASLSTQVAPNLQHHEEPRASSEATTLHQEDDQRQQEFRRLISATYSGLSLDTNRAEIDRMAERELIRIRDRHPSPDSFLNHTNEQLPIEIPSPDYDATPPRSTDSESLELSPVTQNPKEINLVSVPISGESKPISVKETIVQGSTDKEIADMAESLYSPTPKR